MSRTKKTKTKPKVPPSFRVELQKRYVDPRRVAFRESQGWELVKGESPLRGGAVLMQREHKVYAQ